MDPPALLAAQPEVVATAVERAVHKRRNVIHVRAIWAPGMLVVRKIPEVIFKHLKL